jgi:ABC-2 type transport system ATP-binding protein
MMPPDVIRVENLTRTFRQTVAVDGLTFSAAQGEIFGLLGPNGAGKTTTIRLLACLLRPTAGTAWVNGWQLGTDDGMIRRQVGILPETPGLYGKLTARENLKVYARLHRVANADRQIEFYLRLVGLWERRDDFVDRFSRGMRQKVALARALLHEPAVLLLDEPTAALDPQSARTIRDHLRALRDQGRTILLCTHNLAEAEQLCGRVGVLRQRLLAVDTPDRLRSRLYGHQTVLHVRNPDARLVQSLATLDFVRQVSADGDRITVTLDDPERHNPILIEQAVAYGSKLLYVTPAQHTLEEVYLSLIRDQEPT